MTRFQCSCKYCGNTWICFYFIKPRKGTLKCIKCDDRHVRIREAIVSDVFGYGEDEDDGTLDIIDETTD